MAYVGKKPVDVIDLTKSNSFDVTTSATVGGDLTVDTNTLHVDSSNNAVGILTTTPSNASLDIGGRLRVLQDAAATTGAVIIRESSGGVGGHLQFVTNDNSGQRGFIASNSSSDILFGSSAERMRMLSAGGLTFNGDTAAANALDDYEEGSWTPVYQATTTNGSIGYNIQVGHYIKVGDLVTASFRLQTSSASGFAGNLLVGGLPYASKNTTNLFGNGIVGFSNNFVTVAPQVLHLGPNSTQASCITNEGTDAYSELRTAVNASSHLSNTNGHNGLIGTIVYHTD